MRSKSLHWMLKTVLSVQCKLWLFSFSLTSITDIVLHFQIPTRFNSSKQCFLALLFNYLLWPWLHSTKGGKAIALLTSFCPLHHFRANNCKKWSRVLNPGFGSKMREALRTHPQWRVDLHNLLWWNAQHNGSARYFQLISQELLNQELNIYNVIVECVQPEARKAESQPLTLLSEARPSHTAVPNTSAFLPSLV